GGWLPPPDARITGGSPEHEEDGRLSQVPRTGLWASGPNRHHRDGHPPEIAMAKGHLGPTPVTIALWDRQGHGAQHSSSAGVRPAIRAGEARNARRHAPRN